jgi:hypothetical protein
MELIQRLNDDVARKMLSYLKCEDIIVFCKTIKYHHNMLSIMSMIDIPRIPIFIGMLGRWTIRKFFKHYMFLSNDFKIINYMFQYKTLQNIILDLSYIESSKVLQRMPKYNYIKCEYSYTLATHDHHSILNDLPASTIFNILICYDNNDIIAYELKHICYSDVRNIVLNMFSCEKRIKILMCLSYYDKQYFNAYFNNFKYISDPNLLSHYTLDIIVYLVFFKTIKKRTVISSMYYHMSITDYATILLYIPNVHLVYKHLPCDAIHEIKQIQKVLLTNFRNQLTN